MCLELAYILKIYQWGAGTCFFLAGTFLGMLFLCLRKLCHVIYCFFHPLNSSGFAGSCLKPHDWASDWNLGCSRYSRKKPFNEDLSPCTFVVSVVKEV